MFNFFSSSPESLHRENQSVNIFLILSQNKFLFFFFTRIFANLDLGEKPETESSKEGAKSQAVKVKPGFQALNLWKCSKPYLP